MDKIAANNHFVALKKEVKKAKSMVSGNLIRKIGKLKEELEKIKDDAAAQTKLESKINNTYEEIKQLKTVDLYEVAKKATLKPDVKYWDKVISDSKVSVKDRLSARVIIKNNIQKEVTKFRKDHVDCDEWINEYIEYREKKRDLTEISKPKKRKIQKPRSKDLRGPGQKIPGNISRPKHQRSSSEPESDRPKANPRKEDTNSEETESLHPSWASKRKEKELLKAALSGEISQSKRITLTS